MATTVTLQEVRLPTPANLSHLNSISTTDVEAVSDDERLQTLQKVVRQGHRSLVPLREPHLLLHSHMPHILGSAFYLGASAQQLEATYQNVSDTLIKIDASDFPRGESISKENFRQYLMNKKYTVAFMDFFDDEFRHEPNGDWKTVVERYLFEIERPLSGGLVVGHPLIHLAYAYEYESKKFASEGMSLLCTEYFPYTDVLDSPGPDTSTYKTTSLAEIMERVRLDSSLDKSVEYPGIANMDALMKDHRGTVLKHWHAWQVTDPLQQLEQVCDLSLLLAISTGNKDKSFDFFLIHLMTVAHALRVIWNRTPSAQHEYLLREYALLTILIYISQERPIFRADFIDKIPIQGRDWDYVTRTAIAHPAKFDVHFFKVVRAPKVLAETYGEKDGFYLRAALKFLNEFQGFEGFGQVDPNGFDPRQEGWQPEHKMESIKNSTISKSMR